MHGLQLYRIVNSFFTSNTYILYRDDTTDVWLVDCGDVYPIVQWCGKYKKRIRGVLLTHSHFDHIYGLNEILLHDSRIEVYTSSNGAVSLSSSRYNMSLFHDEPFEYTGNKIIIKEGDEIELYPKVVLAVYETPGHDWSCLSFLVKQYLFTGDSYIPNVKLVSNFPKSNKLHAQESLRKIVDLMDTCSYVCPGHGEILILNK